MQRVFILLVSSLMLAGCAGGISPVTRFYTLEAPPAAAYAPLPVPAGLSIGLGPIELPDLLNRPQIVSRDDGNRVEIGSFDNWAGSLQDNMARLMIQQLMVQLNTTRIATYPWPRYREVDYQIRLDVLRFDGVLGGATALKGLWTLVDGKGRRELDTGAFAFEDRAESGEYAGLVAALGRMTARLTDQLAHVLADHLAEGRR